MLDPMQADAYGMFLVHYPIVLWLQYWLFDYDLPAIVKAAIGFVLTVTLSWAATAALRQNPGRDTGVVSNLPAPASSLRGAKRTKQSIFPSQVWIASRCRPRNDGAANLRTPCRSYRPAASFRTPS